MDPVVDVLISDVASRPGGVFTELPRLRIRKVARDADGNPTARWALDFRTGEWVDHPAFTEPPEGTVLELGSLALVASAPGPDWPDGPRRRLTLGPTRPYGDMDTVPRDGGSY